MMTVGELVAYLRLDDGQFNKGIDQAHGKMGKLGSAAGRVGGAIGTTIKRGAMVAGVAITGLIGTALVKGFGRLTAIENAEASLKGLGHSAEEVKGIMVDALKSVKGTAFGLDEAAGIAASAVASGIKPGQQLYSTLRLVADAATIGQSSMSEMGQVFLKVAASNKMQGDVINQLNERHIPIQQFLAKSLDTTAEKVVALASAGKISFPMFAKAMKEGLGGSALASGNTTLGAWKNMMAALSRFGADMLSGIFPSFKVAFNQVGAYLDQLGAKYGPMFKAWGEKVSAAFETGGIRGALKTMLPAGMADSLISTFTVMKDAAISIGKALGSLSKDTLTILGDVFSTASKVTNPIGKAFVALPGPLKEFAVAAGLLAIALNKFGLGGAVKSLLGGLLGKGGTTAAANVPLETAIGLNTIATEANTLALAGKGLPGIGGGKNPVQPLGTAVPAKPIGIFSRFTTWLKGIGTLAVGYLAQAAASAAVASIASVAMIVLPTAIALYVQKHGKGIANVIKDTKTNAERSQQGVAAGGTFWGSSKGYGGMSAKVRYEMQTAKEAADDGGAGIAHSLRISGDRAGANLAAGLHSGVGPALQSIQKVRNAAAKPIHMGKADNSALLKSINAVIARLLALGYSAEQAQGSIDRAMSALGHRASGLGAGGRRVSGAASGAYVPHSPGGTLLRVGEGRYDEVVAQVLPGGGSGTTRGGGDINIHIANVNGTDRRAAEKFADMVGGILMSRQRMKGAMARG